MVHHDADDTDNGPYLFCGHGIALVGDCSPDQRSDRAYLWIAVYGNSLWDRFLFPPIGQLCGVWLGGKMYDVYGDYTLVWWVGVGVGAFSALIHLPVNEKRSAQPA